MCPIKVHGSRGRVNILTLSDGNNPGGVTRGQVFCWNLNQLSFRHFVWDRDRELVKQTFILSEDTQDAQIGIIPLVEMLAEIVQKHCSTPARGEHFEFLPTDQVVTYLKIYVLVLHVTYICLSLFKLNFLRFLGYLSHFQCSKNNVSSARK